ncbi:hypothetical protein PR048_015851, partial [Dryococelus australis]
MELRGKCKGGGNWSSPRKTANQWHRPTRFSRAKIRESNPVHLDGRRGELDTSRKLLSFPDRWQASELSPATILAAEGSLASSHLASDSVMAAIIRVLRFTSTDHVPSLEDTLPLFLQHAAAIAHKYHTITELKKQNLNEEKILIHIYFSENYPYKYNEEIQAVRFGGARQQITLHTGVHYLLPNDNVSARVFCSLFKNNRHDTMEMGAHLKQIFEWLKIQDLNIQRIRILIFSWHDSESGHVKGAYNGVQGNLKITADKPVAEGKDIVELNAVNCKRSPSHMVDNLQRIILQQGMFPHYDVGDHVLIRWAKAVYPGEIISVFEQGALAKNQILEMANNNDEQLYAWEDVLQKSKAPKLIERGFYSVKEIDDHNPHHHPSLIFHRRFVCQSIYIPNPVTMALPKAVENVLEAEVEGRPSKLKSGADVTRRPLQSPRPPLGGRNAAFSQCNSGHRRSHQAPATWSRTLPPVAANGQTSSA